VHLHGQTSQWVRSGRDLNGVLENFADALN
jgi:hypothetical protein